MEIFACKIDYSIHRKLLLYQERCFFLVHEKKFIVDMDIEALWKEEIQVLGKENKRYVQEFLSVIDGIMSNFAPAAPGDSYSYSGTMRPSKHASSLIHAEV